MNSYLSSIEKKIPFSLGQFVAKWPYRYRPVINRNYSKRRIQLNKYNSQNHDEQKLFIWQNMKKIVTHAFQNTDFYSGFYKKHGFNPSEHLNSFDDITNIPIVTKDDLQSVNIEERSSEIKGRYIVNTAGSSGKPLNLYIQPTSIGHEWAHMHTIWEKLGFKYTDLRMSLIGRHSGQDLLSYDPLRHTYNLNIYKDHVKHLNEIYNLFVKRPISYLHGYPSAIYEFAITCRDHLSDEELSVLRSRLQGIFLGSEFPIPQWRKVMESVFDCPSISWYGHTERCILAYEAEKQFLYQPFQTYGYTESVEIGGKHQLIGTSYYNFASPMIRYNTEDVIEPTSIEEEILKEFKVTEGRSGEYILDSNSVKIPLTGLIYGRHHKLFDYSTHIQIRQEYKGKATIFYTSSKEIKNAKGIFNSSGVDVEFRFEWIKTPIKTKSGKIKLLV